MEEADLVADVDTGCLVVAKLARGAREVGCTGFLVDAEVDRIVVEEECKDCLVAEKAESVVGEGCMDFLVAEVTDVGTVEEECMGCPAGEAVEMNVEAEDERPNFEATDHSASLDVRKLFEVVVVIGMSSGQEAQASSLKSRSLLQPCCE